MVIYVVQSGDSLFSIAREYGVTVELLQAANQILPEQGLVVGQALVIPTDFTTHTVVAGDTLYSIARRYGTTVERLIELNPLTQSDPSMLRVGQLITVPTAPQPTRSIVVNGYCYPEIQQSTLDITLPHLTFLSPFSYRINADGTLVPIDDTRVITAAYQRNVAPIMVITNTRPTGGFDPDLVSTVLNDMTVQNTLIENLANTLNQKNYYGLNIDFEYIPPADREAYNAFLERIVARFRPIGYVLSTAVAPKLSADQPGQLYEAHDYATHGRLMDYVVIMTYEWGYLYSPPMAVAPVDQVELVLQYAVTEIPPQKILMGMPNYGYDWTLPFVRGTAARPISNVGAVRLAAQTGSAIMFDQTAQTPFFNYTASDGARHEVWFEDARSVQAKLRLVEQFNLAGVSYWTINQYFSQNWLVLNSMYNVSKRF
ncbi:MAG: LysM peptidoglycan-binding domain-containing protein [Christensenellales bacterium]|jgi:spore germination protein